VRRPRNRVNSSRLLARVTRAERVSLVATGLASGEIKRGIERGAAKAAAELRDADPISLLPAELQLAVNKLKEWDEFDWDGDPGADLFPDAPQRD